MKQSNEHVKDFLYFFKELKDYLNQLYKEKGHIDSNMVILVAHVVNLRFMTKKGEVDSNYVLQNMLLTRSETVTTIGKLLGMGIFISDGKVISLGFSKLPMNLTVS